MKKLVALLLAVLMVMSAAAFAEPVVSEPEMPLTDTPANYDAMIVLHGMDVGDPNEKSLYVAREEQTGVNIEWTVIPSTSQAERIATTFASGELPDLFANMLNNSAAAHLRLSGVHAQLLLHSGDHARRESRSDHARW